VSEDPEILRRLGTTLRDKWTLKRVLGVGGMAAVYVGVHKIGREDAIKILHPEVARSKNVRKRFEQEAHAVNRFKHPGVVEIRDIDVAEDGAPFLVMELLEGESLSARAKRLGGIDPPEVLRMVDDLLDVLAAAHAQGIIHRDIKPDNLFILNDGRLKVLDFGIARMREGAPQTMHTRVGSTLGTVAYMPPEQTMSSKIDERADLFSVGATMFRLLTKRYIHEATSEMDLLVKMASNPAPPLAAVAPHLPEGLCLVVDRALAFEKARRYPDARTMQADVRAVRAGSPPPYATERMRTDGPPSQVPALPAGISGAPSEDLRESATVVPGKTPGGGAPISGSAAFAPLSGPSHVASPASPASPGASAMGLSDERFGMTNTAWSVGTAAPFSPPPAVRVMGVPLAAAGPASLAPSSTPPGASSPGPSLASSQPVSVPPPVSTPPVGRASAPSSPHYTPVLARSSSRPPSYRDTVAATVAALRTKIAALVAALRTKIAALVSRVPEDKRKPVLIGVIAAFVLLTSLVLMLALRSSDDVEPTAKDTEPPASNDRPAAAEPTAKPSAPPSKAPGKVRKRKKHDEN
jgi:serine/threonine-protein kinase